MDCLSPIAITSPSKYISPCFSDKFVNYVRCGRCAACQDTLSREWYFRAFYEYQNTIANNGYMLMDCLTYAPKYVPRVSRFFRAARDCNDYLRLPRNLDFMCFDYSDLRHFFVRLRTYLKKRGFDIAHSLRYFAACEYGTDDNGTHRPHIHILFYVTTPHLDNLTLSRAVATCWKYGRTDGIPYKSAKYVNEYTISKGLISSQRACKYVSKYVMKSSVFQKEIDKRIAKIMHYLYMQRATWYSVTSEKWQFDGSLKTEIAENVDWNTFNSYAKSESGKKLYRDLRRKLDQYHRQSLGFGASALNTFDVDSIIDNNILSIPDSKQIVMRIGLPMYYKRKLFYNLVTVDGVKYWTPNKLGMLYLEKRKIDTYNRLVSFYKSCEPNYKIKVDSESLADYVVNVRGRIDGVFDGDSTVIDRVNSPWCLYNYNTSSDYRRFHMRFIARNYLGNNKRYIDVPIQYMSIDEFKRTFVRVDDDKEIILSQIESAQLSEREAQQRLHDNRQRLNQIYKQLRISV